MNNLIKPMPHVEVRPLSIEREYTMQGHEVIIIEGVRYDAEYFRTFAHPETDVLYAVCRDEDQVRLTIIQTPEQATEFFNETIGRGASLDDTSPTPTEDQDGL